MTEDGFVLGYMEWHEGPQAYTFSGGLLITDPAGVPLEFRHSHPTQVTGMQRALYGNSLVPYVYTELIGKTLWNQAQMKPRLLLVQNRLGLLLANKVDAPIAYVAPKADPSNKKAAEYKVDGTTVSIVVSLPAGETYDIETASEDQSVHQRIKSLMSEASARMNVLEPFDRVRTVLAEAAKKAAAK